MEDIIDQLGGIQGILREFIGAQFRSLSEQITVNQSARQADHDIIIRLQTVSELTLKEVLDIKTQYGARLESAHLRLETAHQRISELEGVKPMIASLTLAVDTLKNEARDLDRWRWKMVGMFTGISFLSTMAAAIAVRLFFRA